MEMNKRLYRSSKSKVFGGVAGGIAEYFDIDPIIIRLLFIIIAFAGGGGILVYFIMWVAIPLEPITPFTMHMNTGDPAAQQAPNPGVDPTDPAFVPVKREGRTSLIGGMVLIALGLIFLVDRFIPRIHFGDIWPLILVVIGGVLIATSLAEKKQDKTL